MSYTTERACLIANGGMVIVDDREAAVCAGFHTQIGTEDDADTDADAIADCVLAAFDALPTRRKPRIVSATRREWVPLAGIVIDRG